MRHAAILTPGPRRAAHPRRRDRAVALKSQATAAEPALAGGALSCGSTGRTPRPGCSARRRWRAATVRQPWACCSARSSTPARPTTRPGPSAPTWSRPTCGPGGPRRRRARRTGAARPPDVGARRLGPRPGSSRGGGRLRRAAGAIGRHVRRPRHAPGGGAEPPLASGETLRARGPGKPIDELTPQELQVATLAAAGLSNKQAAARLFLSVKTIDAHLHRAYRKLGIRSRAELAPILAERDPSAWNARGAPGPP